MPLIFNIPGQGILRLNGAIDKSTATPKLVGKIDATGKNLGEVLKWLQMQSQNLKLDNLKNYNLYSDLLLPPSSMVLNNFYLGLSGTNSEFLGEIRIDKILRLRYGNAEPLRQSERAHAVDNAEINRFCYSMFCLCTWSIYTYVHVETR